MSFNEFMQFAQDLEKTLNLFNSYIETLANQNLEKQQIKKAFQEFKKTGLQVDKMLYAFFVQSARALNEYGFGESSEADALYTVLYDMPIVNTLPYKIESTLFSPNGALFINADNIEKNLKKADINLIQEFKKLKGQLDAQKYLIDGLTDVPFNLKILFKKSPYKKIWKKEKLEKKRN